MIDELQLLAPDPVLQLAADFRNDPRSEKIDLGVGVFRDELGATPIMRAVKDAERELLATQTTKAYVSPEGDGVFVELLGDLAFAALAKDMAGVQTVGGTGALRLGCDLLRAMGVRHMLLPTPSWSNHAAIIQNSSLKLIEAPFYDTATQKIDFGRFMHVLAEGEGGAIILQACCQNPLGADFTLAQWDAIADVLLARRRIAFVDLAYQGFGAGLEPDMEGPRRLLDKLPEALIAVSGSKTFGLYRERVGALFVKCPVAARPALLSNLNMITRANYSMPPDHGAAIVRLVLGEPQRREAWRLELETMRTRIVEIRHLLAATEIKGVSMQAIAAQSGMFSTLPLSPAQVTVLRNDHAIYMTGSARINVAGLQAKDAPRFVAALAAVS
jgi:aromatic-amino-acid transaminase